MGAVLRLTALAILLPAMTSAQDRLLSLDDLFDAEKKVDFSGGLPTGLQWLSGGRWLWPRLDPKAALADLLVVEADSGKTAPLTDQTALEAALVKAGVPAIEARRAARPRSPVLDAEARGLLVGAAGHLYRWDVASARLERLTVEPGAEQATFSPDGRKVAFVRHHDLFVLEVAGRRERPLTHDGSADVLNGLLDWVYQEEVFGRGQFRGYWWSPDSRQLAFLQIEERDVPRHPLVDDTTQPTTFELQAYPRPGDPNPRARLGVARLDGGLTWIDVPTPAPDDRLIVDVDWTGDGRRVAFQVQDREQSWLELRTADPRTGQASTLLREAGRPWVDRTGPARWLKDGSFLWLSERTGFRHLEHHAPDGRLLRALTSGPWEVRTWHGVDEAAGLVYYSGTEHSAIGLEVARVRLDGSERTRLSTRPGTHEAVFDPTLTRYLDAWSDLQTPIQVRLHRSDGSELRVVHDGSVPSLARYRLSRPELFQVEARDGYPMEAMLLRPPDFDPARRYPVLHWVYGGPHAPLLKDRWGGSEGLFQQFQAQRGVVVLLCDNRSTSGKGIEPAWPVHGRLGELELQDVEDAAAWLKRQPWVDPDRIGIAGWSYGGFLAAYALTHSTTFRMGIVGAPVTDWRNYDSVYTERYMRTPQHNLEGYRRSSPRLVAGDLAGKLLLVHGSADDNVHVANTLQFANELQKAGKPFRLQLYPRSRHTFTDPAMVKHWRATAWEFIEETLLR